MNKFIGVREYTKSYRVLIEADSAEEAFEILDNIATYELQFHSEDYKREFIETIKTVKRNK